MASKNLKETIYLKTVLDTSDTLKKAKQLKQQLSSQGADSKSIGRVDKQIVQLEEAYSKLQAAAKSGFSNDAEVTQYLNLLSKVNLKVHEVINSLDEVSSTTFTLNTKDAEKKLNDLKKKAEKTQADILKASKQSAGSLGLSSTQLDSLMSAIKSGDANKVQQIYEDIKKAAKEAVAEQEKVVIAAKKTATEESREAALKKGALTKGKSKANSIIGEAVSLEDRKHLERFRPDTLVKTEKGYKTQISAQGYNLINKTYKDTLLNLENLDTNAEQVFEKLKKKIKNEFNFELKKTDDLIDAITVDLNNLAAVNIDKSISENSNVKKATGELDKRTGRVQTLESTEGIFVTQANSVRASQEELSKGEQEYREGVEKSTTAQKELKKGIEELSEEHRKAAGAEKENAEGTGELLKKQEELANSFDNVKNYISSYLTLGAALREVRQIINQTWQDSKNLDQAFASIAMVTDYSVEEMWQSYDQYSQMAQQLGQRTEDVIKSSALFYQ